MKIFLTAIIAVLGLLVVGVLIFIYSGVYNIAASDPHVQPVEWVLETTRTQSIVARAHAVTVPGDLASEQRISAGAKAYQEMCQMCHLAPGMAPTPLHKGLNPQPPLLAHEVREHTPEYLFWTIKHGIKMTGMPAWGETHSDQDLWNVVAFINQLPEMSPEKYQALTQQHGSGTHAH